MDSMIKISEDGICQTLSGRMGTGGQCSVTYGGQYEFSCKKINAFGVRKIARLS